MKALIRSSKNLNSLFIDPGLTTEMKTDSPSHEIWPGLASPHFRINSPKCYILKKQVENRSLKSKLVDIEFIFLALFVDPMLAE